MTPLEIEEALRQAAAAIYAPLAGYCATTAAEVGEETITVFKCEELQHRAGPYWTALMKVMVDASALTADPAAQMSETYVALCEWFQDKSAVEAQFPLNGVALNGFFFRGTEQGKENERWISSISVLMGVSRLTTP